MKKKILFIIVTVIIGVCSVALAENEAIYNSGTGSLVIPKLIVGSNQYQIDMQQGEGLSFTVTNIIPLQTSPPSTIIGHSRSNPAPIGTPVIFEDHNDYSNGDYEVRSTVLEVIRGDDAWDMIYDANLFNDKPQADQEYILVKIFVEFLSTSKEDVQFQVNDYNTYEAVSSEGVDYPIQSIVLPDPELDIDMYVGASYTGWTGYLINKNDAKPLLSMGREYDGSGGIWLKIYNE